MSTKSEKPGMNAPAIQETTDAGKSTRPAPTRKHDSRLCTCAACLLRELRTEAVRLQDAVNDAEKTYGFPVRVAEICLSIGGYGRLLAEDALIRGVVLNPKVTP